jgi:hypothetical protein
VMELIEDPSRQWSRLLRHAREELCGLRRLVGRDTYEDIALLMQVRRTVER